MVLEAYGWLTTALSKKDNDLDLVEMSRLARIATTMNILSELIHCFD